MIKNVVIYYLIVSNRADAVNCTFITRDIDVIDWHFNRVDAVKFYI